MFVSLLAGVRKNYSTVFMKFDGKAARGQRKKSSHSGGNPDHVTLGLWLRAGTAILRMGRCYLASV